MDSARKEKVKEASQHFQEDIIETLEVIGRCKGKTSENYNDALKLIKARISNLESNLHIEIDMERIEDKSKALSYIGIEIAEALKYIPTPIDEVVDGIEEVTEEKAAPVAQAILEPVKEVATVETTAAAETTKAEEVVGGEMASNEEMEAYFEETRFETKPSLWQRIKNSKFVRTIKFVMSIRVVLDYPALPEGKEN